MNCPPELFCRNGNNGIFLSLSNFRDCFEVNTLKIFVQCKPNASRRRKCFDENLDTIGQSDNVAPLEFDGRFSFVVEKSHFVSSVVFVRVYYSTYRAEMQELFLKFFQTFRIYRSLPMLNVTICPDGENRPVNHFGSPPNVP